MQTKQLQVTAMQSKPRGLVQVKASQPSSEPKRTYIPQMPRSAEKLAAGLLGAAAAVTLALAPPAFAKEPFLKSTGARGPLAREEEELIMLRQEKESEVREELERARVAYEQEVRSEISDGQLCATPFGVDVVGITEFVALTGALVGGISARRRKQELERLNEQLRTINSQLRQQARVGTLYAPGLTYAPIAPGSANGSVVEEAASNAAATITIPKPETTIPVPPPPSVSVPEPASGSDSPGVSLMSIDEEDNAEAKQCQTALKEGKRLLKEKNAGPAMVRFEKALMLAKHMNDKVRERRAVRGLAAASRIAGQSRMAIKYLERVLEISKEIGEYTGDADAYGTIADVYADVGEFEKAAEYYDKYITRMNQDGPV